MTKPVILAEARLTAIPNLATTRPASRDGVYARQPTDPGKVVTSKTGDVVGIPATKTLLDANRRVSHG
jgi:hypothetical protein